MSKLACTVSAIALLAGAMGASAEPLRVAMIEAASGPGGETGVVWTEGIRYGIQQLNAAGGYNGEPIKYQEYDSQGTPGGAADKLRAAIADGVRIVFQSGSSAVAAQINEDVRRHNIRNPGKEVLFISTGAEAYEFTAEKCHFWFFRMTSNSNIRMKALIATMKESGALGAKVYSINQNYSYGQEMQKAQAAYVQANGSAVVEAVLHDVNKIQDFSPYVAKIKASGADTVLTGNWGNDMVLLMKAASSAGLKARFGTTNLDNPGSIGSAGEGALGNFHASPYNAEAGGEAGTKFAEDYRAKIGRYPTFSATAAFGVLLVGEALKAAPSPDKSVDIKRIALAIENAKVMTPMGELAMRKDDHQAVIPLAVSFVSKDARFKADGTDMGLKLVKVVPGPEAAVPVDPACKMQRPG